MRIVVLSDTHQSRSVIEKVIAKHPEADGFIHLGDGVKEFLAVQKLYPDHHYRQVTGNCDFSPALPGEDYWFADGKKIFFTHGHLYAVKAGLDKLKHKAKEAGADIVLFGHTHTAHNEYDGGIYYLNPGSLTHPRGGEATYAVLDIGAHGVMPVLVKAVGL